MGLTGSGRLIRIGPDGGWPGCVAARQFPWIMGIILSVSGIDAQLVYNRPAGEASGHWLERDGTGHLSAPSFDRK